MVLRCPICKKETELSNNPNRPFCSERCKLVDLGAWSSGDYRIPCNELTEEEEFQE